MANVVNHSAAAVERIFREQGPRVVATLIRQLRDFELAEEVVQEAFAIALNKWTYEIPREPAGWILVTARRRAIDRLRGRRTRSCKLEELARTAEIEAELLRGTPEHPVPDDALRLIFICCHPALSVDARVALTLRSLCGLTTAEIARAYLTAESTIAQRIVRAKLKIKAAGIAYRIPAAEELPVRLEGVLAVLYLVFNEGYFPSTGQDSTRIALCDEAIRLAKQLASLLPNASVYGLLALMILQHARRDARVDATATMVPLEDQNRELWRRDEIESGTALLTEALEAGKLCPYQLQAAIAALHSEAFEAKATDWNQIVLLYQQLQRRFPSPVVSLNLAVARGHLCGPEEALKQVDQLSQLEGYQPFHAARADLLRRLSRNSEAAIEYRRASELTDNEVIKRFLAARAASLGIDSVKEPCGF